MKAFFVLISSILIVNSLSKEVEIQENKKADCEESEIFKEHYFTILEYNQDLLEQNNKIPLGMNFNQPSLILGWDVKGRPGPLQGPIEEQAGLILKYIAKYRNRVGSWIPIENPKTHRDVFINQGNLATPDLVTTVTLTNRIKTRQLRFFPEMWDGSPYAAFRVRYCIEANTENSSDWPSNIDGPTKTSHNKKTRHIHHRTKTSHNKKTRHKHINTKKSHKKRKKHKYGPIKTSNNKKVTHKHGPTKITPNKKTNHKNFKNIKHIGKLKLKKKQKDSEECKSNTVWRYSGRREIKDIFSAKVHDSDAQNAAFMDKGYPYLFSSQRKNQYLQVKFFAPSRIFSLKTVGNNDLNDWGGISQFSLFYQNGAGKWKYYTDMRGNKRIFDTGSRNRESVLVPERFLLPRPLDTRIIRIYPHKWTGKPYLSLDIKACYTDDPLPGFDDCSKSILSKDGSLLSVTFDDLPESGLLNNVEKYHTIDLDDEDGPALVTGIKVRQANDKVKVDNIIKSFVLQFMDNELIWKNVADDDGFVKIFSLPANTHLDVPLTFRFPNPVETEYIRLYPESWIGNNPRLFIDILGCLNTD